MVADLAIIGGGAAGLTAAIFAAQTHPGRQITLLDGARQLGAKILVSGGGRCNVTHDRISPDDFNGSRNIVRNVLAAFDIPATIRWFASLGVELKCEPEGKLFPVTNSARTVLDALLGRCGELGITICCGWRVHAIRRDAATFVVEYSGGSLHSGRVILATGGRSLPRSGSDGSGWELARSLGHSIAATHAALVPLVLDDGMFHKALAGISQVVELSTFAAAKRIDRRQGSLLWTHFGISGPVVMDASRHWVIAQESGRQPEMRCNFLPAQDFAQAERRLIELGSSRPRTAITNALSDRFPDRFAAALLRHSQIDPATPCAQLSRDARRVLVRALTALPLPVVGHRGWNYAEVTAGGVPLAEIDYRSMESRKCPGLYLAGEILDCDGRIGGFNFQWAWATGRIAGTAAMR